MMASDDEIKRMRICIDCEGKCDVWRAVNVAAAMTQFCARGLWTRAKRPPQKPYLPGSSTDHEKEAAQAGRLSGCCDPADQY
jgi:hypothetical protein